MEIQFVDNFRKTKNEKIKKIFFCFYSFQQFFKIILKNRSCERKKK